MVILRKALRAMAKNMIKKGRSARNGNAPSPYTKYNKMPYVYSGAYHEWRRNRLAGKAPAAVRDDKFRYQEAAE